MSKPTGNPLKAVLAYEDWQATADATLHGLAFSQFVRALAVRSARGIPPMVNVKRGVLKAAINHGRWVVDCPAGDGGALVVSPDEPLFWCLVCGNEGNQGKWYGVTFPAKRAEIEAALAERGKRAHRNWTDETVEQLLGEVP